MVSGRANVGLYDLRPDSPTEGKWALYVLSGDEPVCLTFPAGTLHGWLFHEPTIHLQAVSEPYELYAADDNPDAVGLILTWASRGPSSPRLSLNALVLPIAR